MNSAESFPALWTHLKCQSAIYLLLVSSVLCLKSDEYMDRDRKDFGL